MITIPREVLKTDPVFKKLLKILIKHHVPAAHTIKALQENSHIPDFCEESRHFTLLPSDSDTLYLHYDIASWFKEPNGIQARIESIGIYDSWEEYEPIRLRSLHGAENKDIPNIN